MALVPSQKLDCAAGHHAQRQHARSRVCLQVCAGQRPQARQLHPQGQHHEDGRRPLHQVLQRGVRLLVNIPADEKERPLKNFIST